MTMNFSYNKAQTKFMLMGFALFIFVLYRKIFIINSGKLIINSNLILSILITIYFGVLWLTMLITLYLKIENNEISLNFFYTPIKQKFKFSEIKSVSIVEKVQLFPIFNYKRISLQMKNGKTKSIYYKYLNIEDQQKVIEVFKDKGLLKD